MKERKMKKRKLKFNRNKKKLARKKLIKIKTSPKPQIKNRFIKIQRENDIHQNQCEDKHYMKDNICS